MTSSASAPIFIIEDDSLMAECLARAARPALPATAAVHTFPDAVSATAALADCLPCLVILDILLNGPDGFTFLNEMISYPDTHDIPIIIVTSLSLADQDLAHYGVRAILNKDTMTPAAIQQAVQAALSAQQELTHA